MDQRFVDGIVSEDLSRRPGVIFINVFPLRIFIIRITIRVRITFIIQLIQVIVRIKRSTIRIFITAVHKIQDVAITYSFESFLLGILIVDIYLFIIYLKLKEQENGTKVRNFNKWRVGMKCIICILLFPINFPTTANI